MKTDEVVNTKLKFPLKHIRHDLSTSMRGQGKRRGGMIVGAMAARTGVSLELDVIATFGCSEPEADEIRGLTSWEFNRYWKLRNNGRDHITAICSAWEDE